MHGRLEFTLITRRILLMYMVIFAVLVFLSVPSRTLAIQVSPKVTSYNRKTVIRLETKNY